MLAKRKIIAKELDNNAGKYEVVKAGFYDIRKDDSPLTAMPYKGNESSSDESSTVILANLLDGVNVRSGKPLRDFKILKGAKLWI